MQKSAPSESGLQACSWSAHQHCLQQLSLLRPLWPQEVCQSTAEGADGQQSTSNVERHLGSNTISKHSYFQTDYSIKTERARVQHAVLAL